MGYLHFIPKGRFAFKRIACYRHFIPEGFFTAVCCKDSTLEVMLPDLIAALLVALLAHSLGQRCEAIMWGNQGRCGNGHCKFDKSDFRNDSILGTSHQNQKVHHRACSECPGGMGLQRK
jgi:hypothetical protein